MPRLDDEVRAVRIEAARILAAFPVGDLPAELHESYTSALAEYENALRARSDLPSGRLNLAVLAERLGEDTLAESYYRTALTMDPYFLPARFNLTNLFDRLGRQSEAETVLLEGIERLPDEGELYYSLGLLRAQSGRVDGATDALRQAARLLPQRARVHYNLGLALQQAGQAEESGRVLLLANDLDPGDADIVLALVHYHLDRKQWEQAEYHAERLVQLQPGSRDAALMLERVRVMRQYGVGQ